MIQILNNCDFLFFINFIQIKNMESTSKNQNIAQCNPKFLIITPKRIQVKNTFEPNILLSELSTQQNTSSKKEIQNNQET